MNLAFPSSITPQSQFQNVCKYTTFPQAAERKDITPNESLSSVFHISTSEATSAALLLKPNPPSTADDNQIY